MTRPEQYQNIAAIGAALKAIEENNAFVFELAQLGSVAQYSREKRSFAPPLVGQSQGRSREQRDFA